MGSAKADPLQVFFVIPKYFRASGEGLTVRLSLHGLRFILYSVAGDLIRKRCNSWTQGDSPGPKCYLKGTHW